MTAPKPAGPTPLPWITGGNVIFNPRPDSEGGGIVAIMADPAGRFVPSDATPVRIDSPRFNEAMANRDLIVKAVAALSLLEETREALTEFRDEWAHRIEGCPQPDCIICRRRADYVARVRSLLFRLEEARK